MVPSVRHKQDQSKAKVKHTDFKKRLSTLSKKAMELSTLCDISVCFVCYDSSGGLHSWPNNRDDVMGIVRKFKETSEINRKKHMTDLQLFLGGEKRKDENSCRVKKRKIQKQNSDSERNTGPDMNEMINGMSDDEVRGLISRVDCRLLELERKIRDLMNLENREGIAETRVSVDTIDLEDEFSDQVLKELADDSGFTIDLDLDEISRLFDDPISEHTSQRMMMMNGNGQNSENSDGIASIAETRIPANVIDLEADFSDQILQELPRGFTTDLDFVDPTQNSNEIFGQFDDPFLRHISQQMIIDGNEQNLENSAGIVQIENSMEDEIRKNQALDQFCQELASGSGAILNPIQNSNCASWRIDDPTMMNNNGQNLISVNNSFAEASVVEALQFPLCQNFHAGIF